MKLSLTDSKTNSEVIVEMDLVRAVQSSQTGGGANIVFDPLHTLEVNESIEAIKEIMNTTELKARK